jgi:hypothetical protein
VQLQDQAKREVFAIQMAQQQALAKAQAAQKQFQIPGLVLADPNFKPTEDDIKKVKAMKPDMDAVESSLRDLQDFLRSKEVEDGNPGNLLENRGTAAKLETFKADITFKIKNAYELGTLDKGTVESVDQFLQLNSSWTNKQSKIDNIGRIINRIRKDNDNKLKTYGFVRNQQSPNINTRGPQKPL